jgi:hypothetical protein
MAQFQSSIDVARAAVRCLQPFIKHTASDLESKPSPVGIMYPWFKLIDSAARDGRL